MSRGRCLSDPGFTTNYNQKSIHIFFMEKYPDSTSTIESLSHHSQDQSEEGEYELDILLSGWPRQEEDIFPLICATFVNSY